MNDKSSPFAALPVHDVLGKIKDMLAEQTRLVLIAPPGAGKTTAVPLALIDEAWAHEKRLIVLEPRRLATRSAARHVAATVSEKPGETIGYRVRMENRTGPRTRLEFVTEGVFTRMVLDDPELSGIAGVVFDEYHERSLEADLGLALALDVQSGLRPDLRIIAMSATLDSANIAQLMGNCPIIESKGKQFPVAIEYLPQRDNERLEDHMIRAISKALADNSNDGDLLCFLPGQSEIMRLAESLEITLPDAKTGYIVICPLYGAMDIQKQDMAILPAPKGKRKIVLATSIAQTSLTIKGITIVIDSGLARLPEYEPQTGLTRLKTRRASKAAITQRAGRAGRLAPGKAIRLWDEISTDNLSDFDPPEIGEAGLEALALTLLNWGVTDPHTLKWLDPPPKPAWAEALSRLGQYGALDQNGTLTNHGKILGQLPLSPALAHMVLKAATFDPRSGSLSQKAALLAILISERGLGGNSPDLETRLEQVQSEKSKRAAAAKSLAQAISKNAINAIAASGGKAVQTPEPEKPENLSAGALLSLAFCDRIAKNMGVGGKGADKTGFLLANGRRAGMDNQHRLTKADFILAADLTGSAASSHIIMGAALDFTEIEALHGTRFSNKREISFDPETRRLIARQTSSLNALVFSKRPVAIDRDDKPAEKLIAALHQHGLELIDFGKKSTLLRKRLTFAHHHKKNSFPDVSDEALLETIDIWLFPFIAETAIGFDAIDDAALLNGLMMLVGYEKKAELDRLAPESFTTPAGTSHFIEYEDERASLMLRVQEVYGLKAHPALLDGKFPIRVELLSPARRPIQTTTDIVGFFKDNWPQIQREMKGRYPKHFWPDDPLAAQATTKTKKAMEKNGKHKQQIKTRY